MVELVEALRIAMGQIGTHKLRSALTALGVIIGIVAVTLMGLAIDGMDTGFERSMALLGDDILYVNKWPWGDVEDWWNYMNRPPITAANAAALNRIIESSPNSLLEVAVPAEAKGVSAKAGPRQVSGVFLEGEVADYGRFLNVDFTEGRLFTEPECDAARQVCVLGCDVATGLFPNHPALGEKVTLGGGHVFRVVGVLAKQGSFLGLFSFDNEVLVPLPAFVKLYGANQHPEILVKVKDKSRIDEATDELLGYMRRVRAQLPGERDNFTINQQQAFRSQLDPIKRGIALVGIFITGLALFVGAIGIMNITFVSVKERTREIGTLKALGARRRTILLQFLIEAVSICMIGGLVGLAVTCGAALAIARLMPNLPVALSPSLVVTGILISTLTGVFAGFAPAWGASRLDPVDALRYE